MNDFHPGQLVLIDRAADTVPNDFARDVAKGLSLPQKALPCRYFYDEAGSRLFERICEVPEYYLTRAETEILERAAPAIAGTIDAAVVVELGSGNATKTRLLLDALGGRHEALVYAPIDIDATMLEASALKLLDDYPRLAVVAIAAEYEEGLARASECFEEPRCTLWLGSSIGNLAPRAATNFLRGALAHPGDSLLIGFDLVKSHDALERAYNDAEGVTAAFNRNILSRINRELGGEFDVERFAHRARFVESPIGDSVDDIEADGGRVVIELVSETEQRVRVAALDTTLDFAAGEAIHTEDSYKWSFGGIDALAAELALEKTTRWLDDEERFALVHFSR